MSDTPTRDAKLVQFLNEAYAKEKQLETSLQAHVEVTTRDDYAKRLKDHLKETKSHATQVSRRIKQLGGQPGDGVGARARRGSAGWPRTWRRSSARRRPPRRARCTRCAAPASRRRCSTTPAPSTPTRRTRSRPTW